ncbi:MAG: hypothetical protein ACOZQL_29800 [Myxococcota bacterium]
MSVVVRYVCHQCGAAREGGGGEGWVRCQHCQALIAFDWQAWLGSEAYARYLRVSAKPETLAAWQRYQQHDAAAAEAVRRGDEPGARREQRRAVELLVSLMPSLYPPELQTDAAYRERYLSWLTWSLQAQKADRELADVQVELLARMQKIDWRDPLPTLDAAQALMKRQVDRLLALDPPEDPDGMPPAARLEAMLTQFLGGYAQLMSPEQVRALLERIHGRGNVHEQGDGVASLGLYREWRCSACGLVSLQATMVHELTCPACVFRVPRGDEQALPRFELTCGRCGAAVVLEAGERERSCAHCDTWVRRVDRTGEVERQFMREVMNETSRRVGVELAPLPVTGVPGLPVTGANRRALQLTGLARQAAMYGALIPAKRWLALVTSTLPDVEPRQALAEIRRAVNEEGANATALQVLADAERLLRA